MFFKCFLSDLKGIYIYNVISDLTQKNPQTFILLVLTVEHRIFIFVHYIVSTILVWIRVAWCVIYHVVSEALSFADRITEDA